MRRSHVCKHMHAARGGGKARRTYLVAFSQGLTSHEAAVRVSVS